MKRSKPITVVPLANGKAVEATFIHTDNYTVIAELTVEAVPGSIRLIREDETHWVALADTIDRVALFAGCAPHPLPIDVEKCYQKYAMDTMLDEEN